MVYSRSGELVLAVACIGFDGHRAGQTKAKQPLSPCCWIFCVSTSEGRYKWYQPASVSPLVPCWSCLLDAKLFPTCLPGRITRFFCSTTPCLKHTWIGSINSTGASVYFLIVTWELRGQLCTHLQICFTGVWAHLNLSSPQDGWKGQGASACKVTLNPRWVGACWYPKGLSLHYAQRIQSKTGPQLRRALIHSFILQE